MKKYKVVRDSREKEGNGWWFPESDRCIGTVVSKLDTGDYSIEGLENILTIERKQNSAEFAQNITEKRFDRELERMEQFQYGFMILEFSMHDILNFPKNSTIPEYKWPQLQITSKYILRRFIEYQVQYKSKIILADYYGSVVAESIFKRVVDNVKK